MDIKPHKGQEAELWSSGTLRGLGDWLEGTFLTAAPELGRLTPKQGRTPPGV